MDDRKARSREPGHPPLRPYLLAILLTLVPLPSPADGPPALDFHVLVGFSGSVRPGRFVPLVVTVSTGGPQLDVRIEAEVSRRSGMGGTAAWRTLARTVTVPRAGSVRAGFALPVPRDPGGLEVRVVRAGGTGQEGPGAILASRLVDLRGASAPGGLVVAVSSELAFDGLPFRSGPDGPARLSYPHPENLPESWAAYDCVDTVILRDTAGLRLRPAQVEALRDWVFAGGTLVASGGAPALLFSSQGLRDLLPVEMTGIRESAGLAPLAAALGVARGPAGAVTLATSTLRGGAAADIVTADGIPLVASRSFGRGTVVFTAFDWAQPSVASWEGLGRLWDRVGGSQRQPLLEEDGPVLQADPWMRPLLASPHLAFPSGLLVLAFAAACVLLFAVLALPRPLGRLPSAARALLLTGTALAAAAAGFLLFNRVTFAPRRVLADAARVDATAGDGLALVTEKLGLLTPGEGPRVGVEADRGAVVNSASAKLPLAVEEQDVRTAAAARGRVSVSAAAGRRFGGGLVVLSDVVALAFDASLSAADGDLTLSISNGSSWALHDVFLARAGRAHAVGTVPPGSRRTLRLDPQTAVPFPPADDRLEPAPDALSADFLAQALPAGDRERAVLVGWLAQSPLGARRAGTDLPAGRPSRLLPGSRALLVLRLR